MTNFGILGWLQLDTIIEPVSTESVNKNIYITSNSSNNFSSVNDYNKKFSSVGTYNHTRGVHSDQEFSATISFAIFAGLLVIILLRGFFAHSKKAGVSGIFALTCLTMTSVIAPVIGSILLLLACYRQCVLSILKITSKKGTFAGLMKGSDSFWAFEDDSSKSIINILALVDFSFIVDTSNYGEEPLRMIQELIEDHLLSNPEPFPKLLCYRKRYLGYFYWERQSCIDVNDHVRWMDIGDNKFKDNLIPENILKNFVSSLSNASLPANDMSGWEILIGHFPIKVEDHLNDTASFNIMENEGNKNIKKYPVLFRVHHTLGDGVALVRLLLDALADPCSRTPSRTPTPSLEFNSQFLLNANSQCSQSNITAINNNQFPKNYNKIHKSQTFLNIPSHVGNTINNNQTDCNSIIKKSASYNFEELNNDYIKSNNIINSSTSLSNCFRVACRKFIDFIDETNKLSHLQIQTQSLQNINLLVNDQLTTRININNNDEIVDIFNKNNCNLITRKSNGISTLNNTTDHEINFTNNKYSSYVTREDRYKFKKLFTDFDDGVCGSTKNYNLYSIITFVKEKLKFIKHILYHLAILTMLPATVSNQFITRTNDLNALHGPKLSGYKVVGWYMENENDEEKLLMTMIKRIRRCTGAHFSDVIITALSNSFENFYERFNEIPNVITAVIPARLGRPDRNEDYNAKVSTAYVKSKNFNAKVTKLYLDKNAKRNHSVLYENSKFNLDNKFSVALLTIPIASNIINFNGKKDDLFSKLQRVQKYTDLLRKSADYLVNYWILNVVATFFPIPILRHMVKSTQSSLVISNMPGPQSMIRLAGHLLHNIVFWVPNRETTGMGVTILSYNGQLQLGVIADRALIPCTEDVQLLVDGMVKSIKLMYQMSSST